MTNVARAHYAVTQKISGTMHFLCFLMQKSQVTIKLRPTLHSIPIKNFYICTLFNKPYLMMKRKIWAGALLMTLALGAEAQTATRDTTMATLRVGYTDGNLNSLAGAVDKVTEERMNKGLVISSLDALVGQSAGVQVMSGVNQEAMVSAVRVRGTTSLTGANDPLVIIDGVTADLTTLSTIYAGDIESFTILKDASQTAQYGSRGASGVIEVATKKGRSQQFQISYDGTVGFESVYKRTEMLNAQQYRKAASDMGVDFVDMGHDTDFTKSIERTGFVQNHHIAFGGGSETAFYRASVGILDHKMVIRTNDYRNYSAKLDLTQKAFDNLLTVDLGIFGSIQKSNQPPFLQKLLYSAEAFNPTFPDGQNEDGTFNKVPEAPWIDNPSAMLNMKQDEDNGHINLHIKGTVNLSDNLKMRAFASYSYNSVNNSHFYPTYVWSRGETYRGNDKNEEILGNISLDYNLKYKEHSLNVMALAEAEMKRGTGFYTTVTNLSTDAFGYDKLSAGSVRLWGGTDSYYIDSHMESFLLHLQYTFMNRYTLTTNVRADASSKVGRNNRWGYFPSVSGAWVISKEEWMKKFRFIKNAKLRIGYGLSGNLGGIDSYNSMQLIQPNGLVPVGGTPITTLGIIRNANPDLKWEVKRTINAGLDLSLWDGRIALSVDYYSSKTTDMLYKYNVPVPPFTYNTILANLGSMKNSGLEIGFGVTPIRTNDVGLAINMNWSFERNKLV